MAAEAQESNCSAFQCLEVQLKCCMYDVKTDSRQTIKTHRQTSTQQRNQQTNPQTALGAAKMQPCGI